MHLKTHLNSISSIYTRVDIWILAWVSEGSVNRYYRIAPFNERYEQEALRNLVFFE